MHPLNYMRLHDQSSGNPRQYWTNVSNGKIRLLRWVAHGQLLRLYIWSFLVSILAKIAPFLPSKNQISDLPSKMSEPCVTGLKVPDCAIRLLYIAGLKVPDCAIRLLYIAAAKKYRSSLRDFMYA